MLPAHGRALTTLEQVQETMNGLLTQQAFAQIARVPELKVEYLARLYWLESFAVGMLKTRMETLPTRELQLKMARHAADEFKHAKWIGERLKELGYEPKPNLQDPYTAGVFAAYEDISWQHFFMQLYVAETRGTQDMAVFKAQLTDDPATQNLLERLMADEVNHVGYLGAALKEQFEHQPELLKPFYKTVWREKLAYLGAMTRIVTLYLGGNRDAIPETMAY